ncbi:endolytic transglycosylase MltG [bacterium]|nr:endolytic transglycosylase MltG [bacterium]
MKKFLLFCLFSLILASGFVFYIYQKGNSYKNPQTITVYFQKGSSLKSIAQELEQNHIIYHRYHFEVMARLTHQDRKLKYGEYEFEEGFTQNQIIEKMAKGLTKKYPLTIPEGYNLKDIAAVVAKSEVLQNKENFLALTQNTDLIKKLNIPINNLEGYIFPDTYNIARETTSADLLKSMTDLMQKNLSDEIVGKAKAMNLDKHALLTLASVIEKETGKASERPLIASVFFNRFKMNMPLQSDPTVIYGIPNFNGNLTRTDLDRDHPYNTYTRPGLPIGPICSPGLESIKAVVSPAQSDFLYFVGKGDGSHYFSKTLEEHNQAVQYYQLKQGNPPGGE